MDVPYYLSKYDPNALREYLTATAPETRDTEPALPVPSRSPEQRKGASEGKELVSMAW